MGLLPNRMSRQQKNRANRKLKQIMTAKQEIALDLAINGPIKKKNRFKITKSGVRRVRK